MCVRFFCLDTPTGESPDPTQLKKIVSKKTIPGSWTIRDQPFGALWLRCGRMVGAMQKLAMVFKKGPRAVDALKKLSYHGAQQYIFFDLHIIHDRFIDEWWFGLINLIGSFIDYQSSTDLELLNQWDLVIT